MAVPTLRVLLGIVAAMTAAGWTLLALVVPSSWTSMVRCSDWGRARRPTSVGVRHAFAADSIAAIDNTTRRLLAEGRRPGAGRHWFALGHSTVAALLATAVALGARSAAALTDDGSGVRQELAVLGAGLPGRFLYGIGFDTATATATATGTGTGTEVTLLALAGTGAAAERRPGAAVLCTNGNPTRAPSLASTQLRARAGHECATRVIRRGGLGLAGRARNAGGEPFRLSAPTYLDALAQASPAGRCTRA